MMTLVISRKLFIQLAAATLFVAGLIFLSASQVKATTIGSDISTGGTLTVSGASTLDAALTLTSTAHPQVTVRYDTTDYYTTAVSSTGGVTFDAVGSALANTFTFADTVYVATSTAQTILTVISSSYTNATSTVAVYQQGTGNA